MSLGMIQIGLSLVGFVCLVKRTNRKKLKIDINFLTVLFIIIFMFVQGIYICYKDFFNEV